MLELGCGPGFVTDLLSELAPEGSLYAVEPSPTLLAQVDAAVGGKTGTNLVSGKNLLRAMLGGQIDLPEFAWQRLNWAWAAFFAFMGVLNIWVAYTFSTSTWATFKAFGGMGLMLVFMVAQGFYMHRHMKPEQAS